VKHLAALIAIIMTAGVVAFGHGNNDHVRGTVTLVSAQAVTIQTDKGVRTFTVTAKTVFEKSGKVATASDLKVGDRVVIDVPKKTTDATLIKFGPPAKAPAPVAGSTSKKP
jgi:phosphate/sulfate permease